MIPRSINVFLNKVEMGVVEKNLFLKTSYSFQLNDQTKVVLEFEKNPFKNIFTKVNHKSKYKDIARVFLLDNNNKKHFVPLKKNYIDILYMTIMEKLGRNNPHRPSGVKTFDFDIDPKITKTDMFINDTLDFVTGNTEVLKYFYDPETQRILDMEAERELKIIKYEKLMNKLNRGF